MPHSVKIFTFLSLHERILTQDKLWIRNIQVETGCHMCQDDSMETALHLLVQCPFALQVWSLLNARLGFSLKAQGSCIMDVWVDSRQARGSLSVVQWSVWFSCTMWHIWKQRNERVFRNIEMTPSLLFAKILSEGRLWSKHCYDGRIESGIALYRQRKIRCYSIVVCL